MATQKTCPVCDGPMVESGIVDGLGLIYMCDNDDCSSHSSDHDCNSCGHPTAYVWIEEEADAATDPDKGEDSAATPGRWERRCFDPLCSTA